MREIHCLLQFGVAEIVIGAQAAHAEAFAAQVYGVRTGFDHTVQDIHFTGWSQQFQFRHHHGVLLKGFLLKNRI